MRILWYSNAPWAPSGYGMQTNLWMPKLQAMGHDVAVASFYGLMGTPMKWNGYTVYPGSSEDQWAMDLMLGHYQRHEADILISLMDAWVLDAGKIQAMRQAGMRFAHWQPVDCEPLGKLDRLVLEAGGGRPIAMSRFGEKQLADFDPLYVPHAIDPQLFKPNARRDELREKAGITFAVGINAANQDPVRKGFGEQLSAFRLLVNAHPDAKMYIHTRKHTHQGGDLDRLIGHLGLEQSVFFGDQYLTAAGLTTQQEIANWYGTLDILSNCSYGEGFGLAPLEAQACGTPVVVTDCSASTELCGSGWKVDGEFYWNAGHGSWWTRPFVRSIYEAYEQAWEATQDGSIAAMRTAARKFALGYDVDLVLNEYWDPVLKELAGDAEAQQAAIRESNVITMSAGAPSKVTTAALAQARNADRPGLADAVLVLSGYKRPDYLRKSLASWLKARGADQLRQVVIALGSSDAEAAQRKAVGSLAAKYGRDIEIVMDSPACALVPGAHRAYAEAANRIFADPACGFLIFGEEDVVVSDDVFEYFAWGRALTAGTALAVVAHNARGNGWQRPVQVDDTDASQAVARLVKSFSPWGWGTWRDTWMDVIEPEWDYDCNKGPRPDQHGCDWQMQRLLMQQDTPVLVPDASRSQNIGREGGIYWNPGDDFSWTQSASFRAHRAPVAYRLGGPA